MNLYSVIWIALFLLFLVLMFRRSSWSIPLYMLTVYAHPTDFWWGREMLSSITTRWQLIAAGCMCVAAVVDSRRRQVGVYVPSKPVIVFLIVFGINATCVHAMDAQDARISLNGLILTWKQIGLCWLMLCTVKDKTDFHKLLISIVIGTSYLAYEYVINEAGGHDDGEMGGNHLSALVCFALPIAGWFLLCGRRYEKILAVGALSLILEFILGTGSRAVFLSLVIGAGFLIMFSPRQLRKRAMVSVILGILAVFLAMGNERDHYVQRFKTIFVDEEQRGQSSQDRILFWQAGVKMIADYPFGSGYEAAFESDRGYDYISHIPQAGYAVDKYRSVHNGYLSLTAAWGIQGAALFLLVTIVSGTHLWRAIRTTLKEQDFDFAFLGLCIVTSLILHLVTVQFGTQWDREQMYWWFAMAVCFGTLLAKTSEQSVRHGHIRQKHASVFDAKRAAFEATSTSTER